jgi:hypothetical protein
LASDRVTWNRRRPKRAAGRLAWSVFVALAAGGPAWLLFGSEPWQADGGALNPLALVAPIVLTFFGIALVPQVIALVRRPIVACDYYALTVRPGVGRTMVLTWAQIAEIVVVDLEEEQMMLIRCRPVLRGSADTPRWWDQATLRSVIRGAAFASAYDLAVPMSDFLGSAESLLADLGTCAPEHVALLLRGPTPITRRSAAPPD